MIALLTSQSLYISIFLPISYHKNAQITEKKLALRVESKVGSLGNIKHKPGGGGKKVFNDVDYLRQTGATSRSGSVGRMGSDRGSISQVNNFGDI